MADWHLLHHTSGLRDYFFLLMIAGFDVADLTNDDDALFLVTRQKKLNFPTGTAFGYSNTKYFLASLVVKRVTRKTLAALAKERIFEPLGMHDTLYLDDHARVVPRRATAYRARSEGGFAVEMSDFEQTGGSAVQTTVDDLSRWDANFYAPKVGSAETIARLRTPGKLDDGTAITYAMGLEEATRNGVAREEHAGWLAGFRAHVVRFPEEKLTVACLCNTMNSEPTRLVDQVAIALLPKHSPPSPGAPQPSTPRSPSPPASEVPLARLAPIAGSYLDPVTFDVRTIAIENGAIVLRLDMGTRGPARPLLALDDRTLLVADVPPETAPTYRFEPAAHGAPARLVRTPKGGSAATFERFEPVTPTAAALGDYAGRYASDEIGRDVQLAVVDGKLAIGMYGRTPAPEPFMPLARDIFRFGDNAFRFERDARGAVRGFTMVADRVQGIRCARVGAPAK